MSGRTAPASAADRAIKRRRVLDILDAREQDSLLLTTHTALTWYLDGSRVHISLAGDPIAAVLVDRDSDHLVTFNNEAGRIAAEDLRFGQRARADPTQGPEIVVIEGRRGDSDQHLFPAGNGIGDLGDLEVAERVVTAVSDRTNCQHGRQR
jgi:hypothetical protein